MSIYTDMTHCFIFFIKKYYVYFITYAIILLPIGIQTLTTTNKVAIIILIHIFLNIDISTSRRKSPQSGITDLKGYANFKF